MQAVAASPLTIKNFSYALTFQQKISQGLGLITKRKEPIYETDDFQFQKSRINPKKHYREYMEDQKQRLLFEIDKLHKQITQLHTQKLELKSIIKKQKIGEVGRLQAQVMYSTTKAEELGEMRQQAIDNSHTIEDLKDLISSNIINYLQHEIKVLNIEVDDLREKTTKDGEKIKYFKEKVEEIKYSELYDTIQSQNRKIQKLKSKINNQIELYQQLKSDVYYLEQEKDLPSPAASEYTTLLKQLKAAQQKYRATQNHYLELRKQQINDFVVTEKLLNQMNEDSNTEIVVSNLPPMFSAKLLRLMFETCGTITSLTIMSDNDQNLTTAHITYSKHSEAKSAINSFNGKEIEDGKLLSVDWLQK